MPRFVQYARILATLKGKGTVLVLVDIQIKF